MTTRRVFTDKFKREAAALLESGGRPLEHGAEGLSIHSSVLRNRRRRVVRPEEPFRTPSDAGLFDAQRFGIPVGGRVGLLLGDRKVHRKA